MQLDEEKGAAMEGRCSGYSVACAVLEVLFACRGAGGCACMQ